MNTTSESLLLRLRKADDNHAWSRFVQLYTPLLFYWARNTGLQSQDAADLVQDVLTIVFRKLPEFRYDPDKSFRGWLRTVTLNRFRELARKRTLGAIDATNSILAQVAGKPGQLESTWDLNYQQSLVARAMELLQPEFQPATWKALREYVMSGRPAAEVAKENGLSVWTVYSAKSRLMVRLREELKGLLD